MKSAKNYNDNENPPSDGFTLPRLPYDRTDRREQDNEKVGEGSDVACEDISVLGLNYYEPPDWSDIPQNKIKFEIIKSGHIIDTICDIKKPYIVIGRYPDNDHILQHESISRRHAIIQFRSCGTAYLYDLNSTHGSFINKKRVEPRVYMVFYPGDILMFGSSTRMYVMTTENADLPLILSPNSEKELLPTNDGSLLVDYSSTSSGLDVSGDINDKMVASMLAEINNLCSSIDQYFNIETSRLSLEVGGSLYHASAKVHINSLIEDATPIEVEATCPSKKVARKKVTIGIYTKLKNAGAFNALKMRCEQQENFNLALKSYHDDNEHDDYYDRSQLKRKRITDYSSKSSPITIKKLLEDRIKLNECIITQRNNVDLAQKAIHDLSLPVEDEIDSVMNQQNIKETQAAIDSYKKEISALKMELEEVERIIKVVSPSSLILTSPEASSNKKEMTPKTPEKSESTPGPVSGKQTSGGNKKSKDTTVCREDKISSSNTASEYNTNPTNDTLRFRKRQRRTPSIDDGEFQDSNETIRTPPESKLKLGLNVPASRVKSSESPLQSKKVVDRHAQVAGPSRPPQELLEAPESSIWDVYETEYSVDCVDPQTSRSILESDIRDLNAKYDY